jgi:hypothetical protein
MIFTTGTSSFTVKSGGVNCDILMIGGGGAGGHTGGGGGGAGACIVAIGHTLPGGDYNVTVGAGGTSASTWVRQLPGWIDCSSGGDSSISVGRTMLYSAKGGGRSSYNISESKGGCGGGATNLIGLGGKDVSTNIVNGVSNIGPTIQPTYAVFGNKGGDQVDGTYDQDPGSTPGGGGIGAAAPNHSIGDLAVGPGGAGLNGARINGIPYNFKSYFANDNPFGHNNNGYIGGGGSGATYRGSTQADGSIGGGGKGAANVISWRSFAAPSTPGAANTGSGGGAGNGWGYGITGNVTFGGNSDGGSGIVIIRYRS